MIRFHALGAFALVLTAGGCVSLLPEAAPAPRLFVLPTGALAVLEPQPVVIAVARPITAQALTGRDIPWRRGVELSYLSAAAWEGDTPEMLHRLLLDVLDRQKVARAVVRVADGALADYEVRWDVTRFEVVEDERDRQTAVFEAIARVLNSKTRTVIATTRLFETTPLPSRTITDAAEGLGNVANLAVSRLGVFAHRVVGEDLAAYPSAASSSR
jgi:ABC-type uncharacterized transport system auxiliary subunit